MIEFLIIVYLVLEVLVWIKHRKDKKLLEKILKPGAGIGSKSCPSA